VLRSRAARRTARGRRSGSSAAFEELDAAGAAGAALEADRPLHGLEVPEPPELEVLLQVDELLAGLVGGPVLLRIE
jgi:hypothetical protein